MSNDNNKATLDYAVPDAATLAKRGTDMLATAKSYVITCHEAREAAAADLQQCKAIYNELEAQRLEITRPLDKAKAGVMNLFRGPLGYLEQAETILKRACITWDNEQKRLERERQAEAAKVADEQRKRLQDEAAKAKAVGNTETAHAITQAAALVTAAPVARSTTKIAGESTRELWSAEVFDLVELARAVGEGRASPEMLLPNMPVLNAQARSLKATLDIPGVRAKSDQSLASRAAA